MQIYVKEKINGKIEDYPNCFQHFWNERMVVLGGLVFLRGDRSWKYVLLLFFIIIIIWAGTQHFLWLHVRRAIN